MEEIVDTRVAETRRFTKSSFVRTVRDRLQILYSYVTSIAVFNKRSGKFYASDVDWSETTRRTLKRFRDQCAVEEEIILDQLELEERVHVYLARHARRQRDLRQGSQASLDEAALERLDDRIMDGEGKAKVRSVQQVNMPVGIPVVFIQPK